MDELIRLVSQRAGIAEESARTAVETVVGFIKEKLPAPIAGQVDSVLSNEQVTGKAGDIADGISGQLGGLFGGGES